MRKLPLWLRWLLCFGASMGMCAIVAFLILVRQEACLGWMCQRWISVQQVVTVGMGFVFIALIGACACSASIIKAMKTMPISLHVALISGVAAAAILSTAGVRHYQTCCREGWRLARGVGHVKSVETQTLSDRGWTAWKFHYAFRVGEVDHVGTYISYFDLRKHQGQAIQRLKAKYGEKMKDAVLVFYDREDPSRSVMMHWVGVPDSVMASRTISLVLFALYSFFIFWRIIGHVEARCSEDRFGATTLLAEPGLGDRPYALPALVALAAYALGVGSFGAFFRNCSDPTLGRGAVWFGPYATGLFGLLSATAGSALLPKNIVSFRWVGAPTGARTASQCSWARLALLALAGFIFVLVDMTVLVGVQSFNVLLAQIALFAAVGLGAAFAVGGPGLLLYRFSRSVRRELLSRGLTLTRYFKRMFVQMLTVDVLGFAGYVTLNLMFCAKVLYPELREVWANILDFGA